MPRKRNVKFAWDTSADDLCHYVLDENIDIAKSNAELIVSGKNTGLEVRAD